MGRHGWKLRLGCLCTGVLLPMAAVTASGTPVSAGPDVPAWLRYERPAAFDSVVEDTRVPMRDGTGLGCSLVRPARGEWPAAGRFPGIVMDFGTLVALHQTSLEQNARWFAERGYVVLMCAVRGTGGSPGVWNPFTALERQDNYDLIEWFAAQPWSTGKVGQTGFSHGAISSYRAATAKPPHLVAIAPVSSYSSPYLDVQYIGGIRGKVLRWWPLFVWAVGAPRQDPAAQVMLAQRAVEWERNASAHPTHDDYWRERDVDGDALDAGDIPVLGIGGWHDFFPRGMAVNYQAARDQSRLLMFPLTHMELVAPASPPELDAARLAWFDHWLLGLSEAPLPGARVTSWELPRRSGHWVEWADWPPAAAMTRFHLNGGRSLASSPGPGSAVSYVVNPFDTSCACMDRGMLPPTPDDPVNDQRVADLSRTHFDSTPLDAGIVVAGEPVAHLRASLSAADGNLVVHLEDVAPDGSVSVITSGWLRASHRRSHQQPEALSPGRTYDFDVRLWPIHWRVPAGHRLRVALTSGDVASIEPNAPAGSVTVAVGHGGSAIDLPLRPGRAG